ncbi:MAG: SH3 domain-containing protein, partial [Planctomycetota bacterium]
MTHFFPRRWTELRRHATLLAAVAGFAGLAGPDARGQAEADPSPYEAKVVENTVPVRSGAGRAYYQVGELKRGDFVTVEREFFGWYEIQAPAGVFCFVERKNVDARGDGSRGIVNTDATKFHAAHFDKGPADSYSWSGNLDAGDEVKIIAAIDNTYKILPPAGTTVFLPPGSIEAGDGSAQAVEQTPPAPAPVTPAKPEPTPPAVVEVPPPPVIVTPVVPEPAPTPVQPAVVETPGPVLPEPQITELPSVDEVSFEEPGAAAPRAAKIDLLNDPDVKVPAPDVPVTTQASNELLRAVEVAILPYFTLPVDRQPIAKMVRGYADAAQIEGLSENDLIIVRTRLAEL